MNGVVPITMKGRACDDHIREVGVRHFDADGIGTGIQLCPDREPGGGPHTPNELDHGFAIDERTPTPVLGDVTEEAVLDLVPLGGAGWKMRDADREARPRSEALQLDFPQRRARTVTAP